MSCIISSLSSERRVIPSVLFLLRRTDDGKPSHPSRPAALGERARGAGALGASAQHRAGPGPARPHRAGQCGRGERHRGRRAVGHHAGHSRQVAAAVYRGPLRWPARRGEARSAAQDRRCRCGARGDDDAGIDAAGRHPLEHALDGQGERAQPGDGRSHLAGLRPQAAPCRDLQAVQRSPVRREGARHRRVVSASAGARRGSVRRREVANPGARPLPAAAAPETRPGGTAHPRLQAPRHHIAVRRPRRGDRRGAGPSAIADTAPSSSASSSAPSTRRCPPTARSMWCSTTTAPTRPP